MPTPVIYEQHIDVPFFSVAGVTIDVTFSSSSPGRRVAASPGEPDRHGGGASTFG
jgi:hypothetical protein